MAGLPRGWPPSHIASIVGIGRPSSLPGCSRTKTGQGFCHGPSVRATIPFVVSVVAAPIDNLDLHAKVPIAVLVERILDVELVDGGLGGMRLAEVPVQHPWAKDYDATGHLGPTRWATSFDVTAWGLIAAHDGKRRVGGTVVAFNTVGVDMFDGRSDLAVLWDIRIRPEARRSGVGTKLFRAAEVWARDLGCRTMRIETQNITVPACRFYQNLGCTLAAVDRFAYPDLPDEVQVIWLKTL